ncbi:MAG: hypothetical protein ACP5Q4_06295 [Candidatus Caldatribacteriaceae bacterium]
MKKIVLVAVLLLLVLAWAGPARSLEGISRDEVIEEAARLTGLSKDTMELLYDETPSLFENIERVAFTIKVTNLFVNARDNEAILELFNRFIDELRSALLPKNPEHFSHRSQCLPDEPRSHPGLRFHSQNGRGHLPALPFHAPGGSQKVRGHEQ